MPPTTRSQSQRGNKLRSRNHKLIIEPFPALRPATSKTPGTWPTHEPLHNPAAHLLALPAECRLIIYAHFFDLVLPAALPSKQLLRLLEYRQNPHQLQSKRAKKALKPRRDPFNLLLTHPMFFDEAFPAMLERCPVLFPLTATAPAFPNSKAMDLLGRHLRSVTLDLNTSRTFQRTGASEPLAATLAVETLSSAQNFPRLRKIEIRWDSRGPGLGIEEILRAACSIHAFPHLLEVRLWDERLMKEVAKTWRTCRRALGLGTAQTLEMMLFSPETDWTAAFADCMDLFGKTGRMGVRIMKINDELGRVVEERLVERREGDCRC